MARVKLPTEMQRHTARLGASSFRERHIATESRPRSAPEAAHERPPTRPRRSEAERPERDLEPFVPPPAVLIARPEGQFVSQAPPVGASRVAETQALVERFVTSMRVGRSSRGAEVHMTLEGRAAEVRVREAQGRLEVELRGLGPEHADMAERIERALNVRGIEAEVRCLRE